MNETKIIKNVAVGVVAMIIAPVVINTGVNLTMRAANGIYNLVEKMRYNKKIKEGLKNGSIVEIDGQYYEVKIEDVEEA